MSSTPKVASLKKVHIRICTGPIASHGGFFRCIYIIPQRRFLLFFWKTIWNCPYCQNYQKVEQWVRETFPNAVVSNGGWREF